MEQLPRASSLEIRVEEGLKFKSPSFFLEEAVAYCWAYI
jgi:hypothetical protein